MFFRNLKVFFCEWSIRGHEWTCAAEEGIPPTKTQIADAAKGFESYSVMYCKKCGYIYAHQKI